MTKDEPKFWCEPAECWRGCEDRQCPYIHTTIWRVAGSDETFASEEAAMLAARKDTPNG